MPSLRFVLSIATWILVAAACTSPLAYADTAADAAILTLYVNDGGIAQWKITIDAKGDTDSVLARKHPADYRSFVFGERTSRASRTAQALQFDGTLEISHGAHHVRVSPIVLKPVSGNPDFVIVDEKGRPLLLAENGHRMPPVDDRVEWRNLDLRAQPELARRLALPAIAGQYLGALEFQLPLTRDLQSRTLPGAGPPHVSTQRNCRDTLQWPDENAPADLAMLDISQIFAMRCAGCNVDTTNGHIVFAPNAELGNIGQADIPWNPKFSAPSPPYGNDQHPFLIWNLYRIDALGRLEQIGASGVKHAFYSVNNDCDCNGDTILFRGCTDLYSAFTNDTNDDLGPRREIIPHAVQWGRCGSIYDADCDGSFDPGAAVAGPYAERLVAVESELLPELNPYASYFFEAWYLVRDDAQLDNSMGHRRVLPQKQESAWSLTALTAMSPGPVIDRWVSRTASSRYGHATRIPTADGALQLGVRVTHLPDGRFRYDYALMNLDFARVSTQGTQPNLQVLTTHGAAGFAIARGAGQTIGDFEFGDGDHDAGNDWPTSASVETVRWIAPAIHTLEWGRLFRFALTADTGPELQDSIVVLATSDPLDTISIQTLAPSVNGHLFVDGFE